MGHDIGARVGGGGGARSLKGTGILEHGIERDCFEGHGIGGGGGIEGHGIDEHGIWGHGIEGARYLGHDIGGGGTVSKGTGILEHGIERGLF